MLTQLLTIALLRVRAVWQAMERRRSVAGCRAHNVDRLAFNVLFASKSHNGANARGLVYLRNTPMTNSVSDLAWDG